MATTPVKTNPATPAAPAAEPERVVTAQEEQIARSEEIQRVGVEKWKDANDDRKKA